MQQYVVASFVNAKINHLFINSKYIDLKGNNSVAKCFMYCC